MDSAGILIAVVAVIYGIGFVVLPMSTWDARTRKMYALGGALLIAVLALVLPNL